MSRRICVLGNSHVAALKGGWEAGKTPDNLKADFFGALSDGMASLSCIEGKLIPKEPEAAEFFCKISGKRTGITPEDYDSFLLCGMGLFPVCVFNNYNRFATPSTRNTKAPHYVSDACMDDLLWDQIDRTMSVHCARLVRKSTDAPIYLAWQAYWAETLLNIAWRAEQMGQLLEYGDQDYVHARMRTIEDRLGEEGFSFLHQPAETITKGIMTKARFSRGSVLFREGLNRPHRDNDVFHMNSDYGARCWQAWAI